MASRNFTKLGKKLATGKIDFSTVIIKGLLITAIPDEAAIDSWEFRNQVLNECTDADYVSAGHFACTSTVSVQVDLTDITDIVITSTNTPDYASPVDIAAVGAILYVDTALATTDDVICILDFGGNVSVVQDSFNITINGAISLDVNIT